MQRLNIEAYYYYKETVNIKNKINYLINIKEQNLTYYIKLNAIVENHISDKPNAI